MRPSCKLLVASYLPGYLSLRSTHETLKTRKQSSQSLPYLAAAATTTIDAAAPLRHDRSSSPASAPQNHLLQLPRVQNEAAAQRAVRQR